jgi:hypothetical protein
MSNRFESEYLSIVDVVKEFDKQLLTVKGWGVTLSLVAVGLGFQYQHRGFFVLAVFSAIGFWLIEAVMKHSQMRYYLRMRDIEVALEDETGAFAPVIDWTWTKAPERFRSGKDAEPVQPYGKVAGYNILRILFYPAVMLPHIVTVLLGTVLFVLALVVGRVF